MFGSQIVDIAIGLIFVYLLLSLICSVLNEWVAALFSMRAKNLEAGIRNMLEGAQKGDKPIADEIYSHGLITALFKPSVVDKALKNEGFPSYIPSRTFGLALLDVIAPAKDGNSQTIENLKTSIAALPEGQAKTALLALLTDAGDSVQKFRTNVEGWFDATMDRVSGWYKRKSQVIILVFALVVSVGLNADSIVIVNQLIRDPVFRNSMVTAAQDYVKDPKNSPIPSPNPSPDPNNPQEAASEAKQKAQQLEQRLESLNVPLGWVRDPTTNKVFPQDATGVALKIVGLLLTAIALSLGAPFWFDMLNKFIVVRSTIKPHEKSPEEGSKGK
jgi:hypothetical protein